MILSMNVRINLPSAIKSAVFLCVLLVECVKAGNFSCPSESKAMLRESLTPGSGSSCDLITLVGLPSAHTMLVARALRGALQALEESRDKLGLPSRSRVVVSMPTRATAAAAAASRLSRQGSSRQRGGAGRSDSDSGSDSSSDSGRCTLVAYRDPKDVLCAIARHHGGLGFSPVALEAKVRHWARRLFLDGAEAGAGAGAGAAAEGSRGELWGTRLVDLERSGARLLRYECFGGCPLDDLTEALITWLHPSGSGGGNSKAATSDIARLQEFPLHQSSSLRAVDDPNDVVQQQHEVHLLLLPIQSRSQTST